MGNYNPHAPVILGQEWVPILTQPYEPENRLERGHSFTLAQTTQLGAAGVYVHQAQPQPVRDQTVWVSVYRRGEETEIGAVRAVLMPSALGTTGTLSGDVSVFINGASAGGGSHGLAVAQPNDNSFIRFAPGSGRARHYFDPTPLSVVQGRRVLAVRLLSTIAGTAFPLPAESSFQVRLSTTVSPNTTPISTVLYDEITVAPASLEQATLRRVDLGEVSPFWTVTPFIGTGVMDTTAASDTFPWRYEELNRFVIDFGSDTLGVDLVSTNIPVDTHVDIGYMALEVIYCEENRVAYGGRQLSPVLLDSGGTPIEWRGDGYDNRQNFVPLLAPDLQPAILAPGEYTYTMRLAPARVALETGARAQHNAARQLYEIPTHPGIEIRVPVAETDTATAEGSDLLPQISLHAATSLEVDDTFTRNVANSWGTADTGQVWSQEGGAAASDFNVNGTAGTHTVNTTGTPRLTYLPAPTELDAWDAEVYVEVETSTLAAGSFLDCTINMRGIGALNSHAGIRFGTDQSITAVFLSLGSTTPTDGGVDTGLTHAINTRYSIRLRVLGSVRAMKVWLTSGPEPSGWTLTRIGSVTFTGGIKTFGCRSRRNAGNTNNVTVSWDNFQVTPYRTLDDTHVYGKQFAVPLWDDSDGTSGAFAFATQGIIQPNGAPVPYSWIRFYARRFGMVPSELLVADLGLTAVASIRSADFDALPEIVDGWREVTLPFDVPLMVGPGTMLQLTGTAGDYASTPDHPSLDITGDLDIRVDAADDWDPGGGIRILTAKWDTDISPGNGSYFLSINDSGELRLTFSTDGSTFTTRTATDLPTPIGDRLAVRATLDVDNGSGGHTVTFFTAPTIAGPWVQLGSPVTTAGTVSIFAGNAPLEVGSRSVGTVQLWSGAVFAVQVRDGIDGVIVANPDFTSQPAGTISFVDSAGRVWTVHGDAEIVSRPDVAMELLWVVQPDPFAGEFTVNSASRWEIISASAPALIGLATPTELDPAHGQSLTRATYGGTIAQLEIVSSQFELDDEFPWADVAVLLSQDPPTVTAFPAGFEVTVQVQALAGIGADCGIDPRCIPTGLLFHQLTWADVGAAGFGRYEIQRFDELDAGWHTIALVDCHNHTRFNDFEARVGIESRYRIRVLNLYGFEGSWSPVLASTLPAPGVVGDHVQNGVLIFTSNERQNGAINLAYTMAWQTNNPEEQFTFPEAGEVQFHPVFNRDFRIAFRPLERGGERFTRTLLVQAAAIAPPQLADFHSLRDMAWDTVPYICVRDELGDRWLAAIRIPEGTVRRNRRLYLAQVEIDEVTDTPSVVSPACVQEEVS